MSDLDDLINDLWAWSLSDTDTYEADQVYYGIVYRAEKLYGESRAAALDRVGRLVTWIRSQPQYSFGIMPDKLASRESGWGDDGDRDSTQAAKLSALVRDMDASVAAWREEWEGFDLDEGDAVLMAEEADRIMSIWQAIRVITRGEGGK